MFNFWQTENYLYLKVHNCTQMLLSAALPSNDHVTLSSYNFSHTLTFQTLIKNLPHISKSILSLILLASSYMAYPCLFQMVLAIKETIINITRLQSMIHHHKIPVFFSNQEIHAYMYDIEEIVTC